MGNTLMEISVPLDKENFIELECDFCKNRFMLHQDVYESDDNINFFCPICGLPNKINTFFVPEVLEKAQQMAMNYMLDGIGDRTDAVAMTTKRIAENYTAEIMKKLIAHGYREELVHLYIIGGGGCLLQNFSDLTAKPEVTVITDICANAKGYEALAMMKQRMRG